jgi:PAS domain S-box-containing protein
MLNEPQTSERALRADAALRASEMRLRDVLDSVPNGFYAIDADWNIIVFNAVAEQLFNRRRDDVLGRNIWDVFPEARGTEFERRFERIMQTGRAETFEAASATRIGRISEIRAGPRPGGGMAVVVSDVTDRRRAEARRQALIELTDQFRDLDDPIDIGTAAFAMLGRIFDVDQVGYGAIDLEAETLLVERAWAAPGTETFNGLLRFCDFGAILDDLKRGETVAIADLAKDPRTADRADVLKTINLRSMVNAPIMEHGALVAMVYLKHGAPRDWSPEDLNFIHEVADRTRSAVERRRAEKELIALAASLERQVEERTRERDRIWHLSGDLLAVTNVEGYFESVNPAWQAVLGWTPAELFAVAVNDLLHPDDIDETVAVQVGTKPGERIIKFENRFRTKSGDYRWLSWNGVREGEHVYTVARDITEDKRRAAELEAAQVQLRQSQKLEAMGQLTGGVAHDFNNLLMPITGALDLLQRQRLGGEREQKLILGALQSAERAKTLVQRLLAFARRQPLQPSSVNVCALIQGMVDLIISTAGPQIAVSLLLDEDTPPAKADPNQLELALLNLSVNARDAMPDGGRLTISAEAEEIGWGHYAKLSPGAYVRIVVADTGIGMDETVVARAIEPFFSTKGVGKGTGLGLSMVHGLTSQLGGGLHIASAPGEGARIALWLPVSGEAAAIQVAAPGPNDAVKGSGRVLLVDDDDLARMSTADMLVELGYEVIEARSGYEALHLVERGLQIDLLITDHLMPGVTGVELARSFCAGGTVCRAVIVSGFAETDGLDLDIPRLTKPFRQADLAAVLAKLAQP